MMSANFIIQLVAILIACSCSFLGVFLVLKKMSMLTDAITHTVLLGIIISFFIVKDLSSPVLLFGASITGLITVFLVELLVNSRMMKEDASIGVILSFLFSIAVLLISRYAANVHIDVDAVLLGEIAFAPFHTKILFGHKVITGIVNGIFILSLNFAFVMLFFKELKISIFDKALASSLGLMPILIHYILMALVSLTSVIAFESVGAILLVSFMIGPPVSAYLISKSLKNMIIFSLIISIISCIIGFHLAMLLDVSIAGMIAVVIGIIFLFILTMVKILKFVRV